MYTFGYRTIRVPLLAVERCDQNVGRMFFDFSIGKVIIWRFSKGKRAKRCNNAKISGDGILSTQRIPRGRDRILSTQRIRRGRDPIVSTQRMGRGRDPILCTQRIRRGRDLILSTQRISRWHVILGIVKKMGIFINYQFWFVIMSSCHHVIMSSCHGAQ